LNQVCYCPVSTGGVAYAWKELPGGQHSCPGSAGDATGLCKRVVAMENKNPFSQQGRQVIISKKGQIAPKKAKYAINTQQHLQNTQMRS